MGKSLENWQIYQLPELFRGFVQMKLRWNGNEVQCSLHLNHPWARTHWTQCNQIKAKSGNGVEKRAQKMCPCEAMRKRIDSVESPEKKPKKMKH